MGAIPLFLRLELKCRKTRRTHLSGSRAKRSLGPAGGEASHACARLARSGKRHRGLDIRFECGKLTGAEGNGRG